jgi:integrase
MAKQPSPPKVRNGLKWRDGRPRWEPSPASRAAGFKGVDLKDLDGAWIADRGIAISICDGRHTWVKAMRDAARPGADGEAAQGRLRQVVETLQAPQTPDQRLRRLLTQDLLDAAQALLEGHVAVPGVRSVAAPKTVARLVDTYFDAVDAGRIKIKPSTRKAYSAQRARIIQKFGDRATSSVRRIEVKAWYHDELSESESRATANLTIGAMAAFFNYALDLEWISQGSNPMFKLGQKRAKGRRVFWTMEEERAFVPWCDAQGYCDVADAVVLGLYTGARQIDQCAANLEDFAGEVWRFSPIKTERHGQEAMPAILPQVRERLDRRWAAVRTTPIRHLANTTPLIWYEGAGRRHDSNSIGRRFAQAKAQFLLDAAPSMSGFGAKRLQDTRDTCITRLWLAGVKLGRIWSWSGHSPSSVEDILREHYLVLRAEGQVELGRMLEAWAQKEALKLN